MTWDQVLVWLIWPAIVAAFVGFGGLWLSRRIPQPVPLFWQGWLAFMIAVAITVALIWHETPDALIDAGASEEKAQRAAEELAGNDNRLAGIDARLAGIDARLTGMDARLTMLTWAVGVSVAVSLAVLAKLFGSH